MTSLKEPCHSDVQAARDNIMEMLQILYVEFRSIGKFEDAMPSLNELMSIAYGKLPSRITESKEYQRRSPTAALRSTSA
jgi:hypothetical protein